MNEARVRGRFVVGLLCYFSIACVEAPPRPPRPLPHSRWDESYSYHWAPPTGGGVPVSAGLTVCIVRPNFGSDADNVLRDPVYRKWAKGFSSSMATDLDKALVEKKVRVSGPYDTYDDITYPDKQSSDLALTPAVFLVPTIHEVESGAAGQAGPATAESDPGTDGWVGRRFRMDVQGFVAFELREPLSKEKLWVKKLELEPETATGLVCYEALAVRNSEGYVVGYNQGRVLYDGKQDALADIMEKWYPQIMDKAWTYLNVEEMRSLRPQIDEIRKMKRY